jgi:hypothetical protein
MLSETSEEEHCVVTKSTHSEQVLELAFEVDSRKRNSKLSLLKKRKRFYVL